jgi:catechol 2,3-dioxygenase-like lactoylglutathione lyase family enzyme
MKLSSVSGLTCDVADLDRTVAFYESLGFRIGKRDDAQATCYVNWFWMTFNAADAAETAADGPREPSAVAGPAVHLKVDDIDQAYQDVLAAGHKPEGEPAKRTGGGKEFVLLDPDGYRLVLFYKK